MLNLFMYICSSCFRRIPRWMLHRMSFATKDAKTLQLVIPNCVPPTR
jgi:hypothetical protein